MRLIAYWTKQRQRPQDFLDEAKQRAQILYADNKSKGYEDGLAECQREFDEKEISLRQELSDKESALKSKYDAYSKELESDLIDAIIQVLTMSLKYSSMIKRISCFIWLKIPCQI